MNTIIQSIIIASTFVLQYVLCQFPLEAGCPYPGHPITCPTSYTRDANGCPICATSHTGSVSMNNPGGDPLHQGGAQMSVSSGDSSTSLTSSRVFSNPCVPGTTCDITCEHGYANGQMNTCQYCVCATLEELNGYTSPCSDAPPTCDLSCPGGFTTGTNNCQYCMCTSAQTTEAPPMKASTISAEECTMKIMSCQIRYPFGFMTDDKCELCIGKDEIYLVNSIPEERQPVIQLANPCIKNFDRCMIICRTGYRTGPRNCQYCACNN